MNAAEQLAATAIRIDHASKAYPTRDGSILALRDVSLDVADHEFIAVLGPSGCGKTTLLKIIAGLEPPSQGEISLHGRPIRGPQKKTGIVFQTPALMKWRTAVDNVMFPAEILGLPERVTRAKAMELLKLVGIADFAERLPHELSGGMQQRVAIARALIHDPTVLLLDEPFSALDTMTRGQLNVELLRIWSETRKTSLLITHSIPEAVFLADRVVIMTPRPASIREIVTIDLPRPRTPEMRVSPEFTRLVDQIGRVIGLEYV
jgi:NitT/TauT family transport system ATP-binding protein